MGSAATATAERAGKRSPKALAYTSFMAAKSAMSVMKTVVLATSARPAPLSASIAARLASACSASALTPPATRVPSRRPTWPETISQGPARTTGVYGSGARSRALRPASPSHHPIGHDAGHPGAAQLNDWPQPQVRVALGLLMEKPAPCKPSL